MILGTVQLVGGKATFPTSSLPSGANLISAAYAGDSDFQPKHVGNADRDGRTPAHYLSDHHQAELSPKATKVGQRVTLTATVKARSGFDGTPNGEVTFMDGAIVLWYEPIAARNGDPECRQPLARIHSIQADYPGNQSFDLSFSAVLSEKVTAKRKRKKAAALGTSVLSAYGRAELDG